MEISGHRNIQKTIQIRICGTLFNPIPTELGHVTLIYGLIPPMAGRNRVKEYLVECATLCVKSEVIL